MLLLSRSHLMSSHRLVSPIPPFRRVPRTLAAFALLFVLSGLGFAQSSLWVRPTRAGDPLIWGRRDGIVFGLQSNGGIRGPRGLIRVGPWSGGNLQNELLNFIAVEPVVQGPGARFDRMAFSELEMSELDPGQRGKRMSVNDTGEANAVAGKLKTVHIGRKSIERLSVRIDVERFTANGAHVYLVVSIDSDQPSELQLRAVAEKDSAPLEELTLTATMGNYERLRLLWLKDTIASSRQSFGDYTGEAFVEGPGFPLPDILRDPDGGAITYATTDEPDPGTTPGNDAAHWPYTLPKLTQYWRVPGYDVQPDLRVRVNARRVYWASTAPVLGGIAFENFEMRQRYVPGQTFIYGISPLDPPLLFRGRPTLTPYNGQHFEDGAKPRP